MDRSYYEVLGVARDASPEEIEHAFRQAARRVHPDLHPGDAAAEERMKALNVIHATLMDAALRAAYDRKQGNTSASASPRPAPRPPRNAPRPPPPEPPAPPSPDLAPRPARTISPADVGFVVLAVVLGMMVLRFVFLLRRMFVGPG